MSSIALRDSGGKSVESGCFPPFQFVDGTGDFFESDWCVNGGKTLFLFNEVKYCVIDGSVGVQDFVEVHAKDGYVFLGVGG